VEFDLDFTAKIGRPPRRQPRKKIEGETKMKVKSSRGIAMKLICCMALVVLSSVVAFSATPTSGALLQIDGTAGSTAVHIKLYDSQIHSGLVQSVPTGGGSSCLAADQIPTDAYVLQGGSATGCDAGDAFEVTESNNTNAGHQAFGHADLSNFHIETRYVCGGACSGGITGSGPVCNTSGTICANPDNGFVTITNNTGSAFSGTISLTGNSPIAGDPFCPAALVAGGPGVASDTWTSGLTTAGAGQSVTLALGSQGSPTPKNADSSNCGGFNAPQRLTLNSNVTTSATFGADAYQITPFNANGQKIDVLPVPVPSGFTQPSTPAVTNSALFFDPGTNFSGQKCFAYSDFSAVKNPVCAELQVQCTVSGACDNIIYSAEADYDIDASSLPNPVGGPAFLGHHGVQCPDNSFDLNIFQSYTATTPDPLKGGGSGTGSCYVATFDPTNTNPVAPGTTVTQHVFVGFSAPVSDTDLNIVKAGSTVPLKWQEFDASGTALQTLNLCNNQSGTGCNKPWIFLGMIPSACQSDSSPNLLPPETGLATNIGLVNNGGGNFQFNWVTPKSPGCVNVIVVLDSGLALVPVNLGFKLK
jgi:hypothetical protein